jgi:hypothetical protein
MAARADRIFLQAGLGDHETRSETVEQLLAVGRLVERPQAEASLECLGRGRDPGGGKRCGQHAVACGECRLQALGQHLLDIRLLAARGEAQTKPQRIGGRGRV